jgi:histidinol phosphatase-like PHP family hydrolase
LNRGNQIDQAIEGADFVSNAGLAELLAAKAEAARPPLTKAFRRASRRALLWPVEAGTLLREGRSLTELSGIGPYLEKVIEDWVDHPPAIPAPPALRAGFLTLTQARAVLTRNPAWPSALKGDLQMHTNWSDGSGSLADMADAANQRSYEFIAITDHSKGLKIAGGIDENQLRRQSVEIEITNERLRQSGSGLRLLRSIELNLNPRGEGDMDVAALSELDLVLGCFHSSLRRKEDQTDRYLAALSNPAIQILGHPRGRIYNFRAGLTADWARVFALAAKLDKAVEIDCYPDRQDLSFDLVVLAKRAGCRISLGTDAHGPSQLSFIEFGLASALLAGVQRERILNFLSVDELTSWVDGLRAIRKSKTPRHARTTGKAVLTAMKR